ncbi:uncharacterized protein CLUP02_11127 [Colletotrichum lupini]|uniref:Uncharacterized protein n=1 Tax=Colletotrichum lupini TaxID=145971 RepID=A0A9Q8WJ76_9PEZI|nr:uncharacterized protein CLUP02_11127 [Colletotrichum lupini]UQC85628.1 hypothetical protein CLUP02_11127 [Colletotrichum lupini]
MGVSFWFFGNFSAPSFLFFLRRSYSVDLSIRQLSNILLDSLGASAVLPIYISTSAPFNLGTEYSHLPSPRCIYLTQFQGFFQITPSCESHLISSITKPPLTYITLRILALRIEALTALPYGYAAGIRIPCAISAPSFLFSLTSEPSHRSHDLYECPTERETHERREAQSDPVQSSLHNNQSSRRTFTAFGASQTVNQFLECQDQRQRHYRTGSRAISVSVSVRRQPLFSNPVIPRLKATRATPLSPSLSLVSPTLKHDPDSIVPISAVSTPAPSDLPTYG